MSETNFDWSPYPLHESTLSQSEKCRTLIRISEQMLYAVEVDNPTNRHIELIEKHTSIIKFNKAKLLLLGGS